MEPPVLLELWMLCCDGLEGLVRSPGGWRGLRPLAAASVAALLFGLATPARAAAILASCADGSVVLVKEWEDVRCEGAIRVTPGADAGLGAARHVSEDRRAKLLAWEADRERRMEALLADRLRRVPLREEERRALVGALAGGAPLGSEVVGPATEGAEGTRLRLVYLPAFDSLLRRRLAATGLATPGPILVFHLEPGASAATEERPAFAQGGVTFHPTPGERRHIGWIDGAGRRDVPGTRYGYVALPEGFDPARPILVFWGDTVVAAKLGPAARTR